MENTQQNSSELNSPEIKQILQDYEQNRKKYLLQVLGLFILFVLGFFLLYLYMPKLSEEEKQFMMQIPATPQHMMIWNYILVKYSQENFYFVLGFFFYVYIFMQCFSIPGHGFLSLLSGSIWGLKMGLILSCFCSTIGAACAFFLSQSIIKGCVIKTFSNKVNNFIQKVKRNKQNLLYYCLFIRITPIIPNMIVNVASPIAGIPLHIFLFGTFFGRIPINYIHVQMGATLKDITQIGMKQEHFLVLIVLSILSIIPTFFTKKEEEKQNSQINEKVKANQLIYH